jgi:hypothetical protein
MADMDASGTEAEQQPAEGGRDPVGIDAPGSYRLEMASTSSVLASGTCTGPSHTGTEWHSAAEGSSRINAGGFGRQEMEPVSEAGSLSCCPGAAAVAGMGTTGKETTAPAFSFRNRSAGGSRETRRGTAAGEGPEACGRTASGGGARGRAGRPLPPGEGPTAKHIGGARGGAPRRPDDDSGEPWDGRREDVERALDLVAAEAELDGGGRSRRRRRRAFPRRGHVASRSGGVLELLVLFFMTTSGNNLKHTYQWRF